MDDIIHIVANSDVIYIGSMEASYGRKNRKTCMGRIEAANIESNWWIMRVYSSMVYVNVTNTRYKEKQFLHAEFVLDAIDTLGELAWCSIWYTTRTCAALVGCIWFAVVFIHMQRL